MYVYLKNNRIYHKSEEKKLIADTTIVECPYRVTDDLIYEEGEIKLYEKSVQYNKDHNIKTKDEELVQLRIENEELREIADNEIRSALGMGENEKVTQFKKLLYRQTIRKC
jgi:hypothetical protein